MYPLKHYLRYSILLLLPGFIARAQPTFYNNPANHIVVANPAFSAIHPFLNRNYTGRQLNISSRVSQRQSDALISGQYFFEKQNIGVSADYGLASTSGNLQQKAGFGLSYQLIFFDRISTGWGAGVHYNRLQVNQPTLLRIYNKEYADTLFNTAFTTISFGGLINFEQFMVGYSFEPKALTVFSDTKKSMYSTTQTIYFKTYSPLTRRLNAILWYNASFNNLYQTDHTKPTHQIQSHSVHLHVSGRKGLIGGIGSRFTNFGYVSAIAKAGYHKRNWQVVYGAEPYWLGNTYSEIIHELSFTLKFN